MSETFFDLLKSAAHWEFEIFLTLIFDGLLGAMLWPWASKHWKHHIARDRAEIKPVETPEGICLACHGALIMFQGGDYCPGCGTFSEYNECVTCTPPVFGLPSGRFGAGDSQKTPAKKCTGL